ncbi:MAG TPA: site-2 protease family protein [Thermoplasmata archaeon]|nr:site-2 protease family protein [Thermoplasmata archaeon]
MAAGAGRGTGPASTELERIRATVATYFPVYETTVAAQSLLLAVQIDRTTLEAKFDRLRLELWAQGYVPFLRRLAGEDVVEVVRRPPSRPRGLWVNLVLLAATVATTVFAGALIWLTYTGGTSLTTADVLLGGLYFALPILAILGFHELAHYAAARRRGLDASLPFFIPVPPPLPFGTFGAFVSIRAPFPDRKAQFDVSAAGPLVGFVIALPIALAGLYLSAHAPVVPANVCTPTVLGLNYGEYLFSPSSLLWHLFGLFLPASLVGAQPLALAGWVGVLVTAINLLPIGALDGGRVFRAVFGERSRYVSYIGAAALLGLGLFYTGWLVFAFLILFLGLRNPAPLNDSTTLDAKRYILAACVIVILVTGFAVVPIQSPTGAINLAAGPPSDVAPPPGAVIAASVEFALGNPDLVSHGFLASAEVVGAIVQNGSNTTTLTGSALASWAAASNWTFVLPNGTHVAAGPGAAVELPANDYVTLPSGAQTTLGLDFSSPNEAVTVTVQFAVAELCPPSTGGHASVQVALAFA